MKVQLYATDPDEMDVTLEITMPLKKWRELRERIASADPGWELRKAITDAVVMAEKHFRPELTEGE